MLSFLLGLIVGGTIGVLFMAIFQFSRKCEEYEDTVTDEIID